jgi:alkylation response protein AidB-like acyl-CoA dehydrogenase
VGGDAPGLSGEHLELLSDHAVGRLVFDGVHVTAEDVIGDMAIRVEASRLQVTRRSAMAKLYATESAQYVVDTAIQLHGARALLRGHLLEGPYRDVRAPRIYEGASAVQRTIIGRSLTRPARRGVQ